MNSSTGRVSSHLFVRFEISRRLRFRGEESGLLAAFFLALWSVSMAAPANAALNEYRVQFEPSGSPEAVGYTLHIGKAPGAYSVGFDLANPPSSGGTIVYAVELEDSVDLFLSLRAYDAQGALSDYSNEIRVAAVVVPEPAPEPEPSPAPAPAPIPTPEPIPTQTPQPEPAPTPIPDPAEGTASVLFFDDFESYAAGQDPTGWLDTDSGNALTERAQLFSVAPAPDGGMVFQTRSSETNIHSHFVANDSLAWWGYDSVGRMRFEDASAGIGVTVLSDYPNSDSYLRLRRWSRETSFYLAPHSQSATDVCVGSTDTGVESLPNTWYRFRFRTLDEGGATRVLARVWDERQAEPDHWQIDCLWSAWPDAAGRPGVWSMGPGQKMWDDLGAQEIAQTEPDESPMPPPDDFDGLYAEDFDRLHLGSDPVGWLDTAAKNSLEPAPELFSVGAAPGGGRALTNSASEANIHSHFLGDEASGWQDYEYSGRMQISSNWSGVGVTVYSDYPDSDQYIRLRRYRQRPDFHIANHPNGAAQCVGDDRSGVESVPGVWYAFRMRAFDDDAGIRVQARVWAENDEEPNEWQIDCTTPNEGALATGGAPGVWSMGRGEKFWDDLVVEPLTLPAP